MEFVITKTETWRATFIKREWMKMSPRYRDIRSRSRNPMCSCKRCGYRFEDGEMMALGMFDKRPNATLCQECADYLLAKTTENGTTP